MIIFDKNNIIYTCKRCNVKVKFSGISNNKKVYYCKKCLRLIQEKDLAIKLKKWD